MASTKTRISMGNDPEMKALLKKLQLLGKEANTELRDDVMVISKEFAQAIVNAASTAPNSDQALRIAQTVRPVRDRIPAITVGGSRAKFSGGANAGIALFGNEFGSDNTWNFNNGRRFPPRSPKTGSGNAGYWIFPTLKALQPFLAKEWKQSVDKILRKWGQP